MSEQQLFRVGAVTAGAEVQAEQRGCCFGSGLGLGVAYTDACGL